VFVKVQEEKKQQIMSNDLHPKRESLFVLHEELATLRSNYVSSIVSSFISFVSGGHLTLCGFPDSVCRHSTGKNQLLMEIIEKDHQKPFLNIIVLEFIDSCELVQRIADLNCYDINATETNFSTRNSFGKV
jgi:hypothetical protein